MSINIIADILNCGPYFQGSKRATFVALANFADHDGKCWPSMEALAFTAGNSTRQVRRDLIWLENIGMIAREVGGGRCSTHYQIAAAALEAMAAHLNRHKAAAKNAGRDRYEAVAIEAKRMLREDELAAHERKASESSAREDTLSPLDGEIGDVENDANVRAPRTGCPPCPDIRVRAPRTGCPPSPDKACPGNLQITFEKTFTETDRTPEPPPDKRAALRERLARIDKAADAIGMEGTRLRLMVGGISDAEALIGRWESEELTADELRIAVLAAGKAGLGNGAGRPIAPEAMNARQLVAHAICGAGSITVRGLPVIAFVGPNLAERAAA